MKKWTVVVIIDGVILKAVGDGTEQGTTFEGREKDIAMAKAVIRHEFEICLGNSKISPVVLASYESALGLTAALVGVAPSRTKIWRAPADVTKFIEKYENEHNWEMRKYGKKGI